MRPNLPLRLLLKSDHRKRPYDHGVMRHRCGARIPLIPTHFPVTDAAPMTWIQPPPEKNPSASSVFVAAYVQISPGSDVNGHERAHDVDNVLRTVHVDSGVAPDARHPFDAGTPALGTHQPLVPSFQSMFTGTRSVVGLHSLAEISR